MRYARLAAVSCLLLPCGALATAAEPSAEAKLIWITDEFKAYQSQIVKNAKVLAETLLAEGYRLVSGGTDTHLILIDLADKGLSGKEAQETLDRAGITANKNRIPFDKKSPQVASGFRVGTPAVTTRGMKEEEMKTIGLLISEVIKHRDEVGRLQEIREEVKVLCHRFPLYYERVNNNSLVKIA